MSSLSISPVGGHNPFHTNPKKEGVVNRLILLAISMISLIVIVSSTYGRPCSILHALIHFNLGLTLGGKCDCFPFYREGNLRFKNS